MGGFKACQESNPGSEVQPLPGSQQQRWPKRKCRSSVENAGTAKTSSSPFPKPLLSFTSSLKPPWSFFPPRKEASHAVHAPAPRHTLTVCPHCPQPSRVSAPGLFFVAYTRGPEPPHMSAQRWQEGQAGPTEQPPWPLWSASLISTLTCGLFLSSWGVVCFSTAQGATAVWGRRAPCVTDRAERPAGSLVTPSSPSCSNSSWYNLGSPLGPGSDD